MPTNFLMKGHVWAERKKFVRYPVNVEAKMDEIRLHVRLLQSPEEVQFLSYTGKPIYNMSAFAPKFAALMRAHGVVDLDCGLEVNGNFTDSARWAKSSTGYPKEKFDKATGKTHPALFAHMVKVYLFDLPHWGNSPYIHRREYIKSLADASHLDPRFMPLYVVPAIHAENEEEVMRAFYEYRAQGLEGAMVKQHDGLYVLGRGYRSDDWLKLKPSDTKDGKIIAINRAYSIHGDPLDRAGSVTVELEDGSLASPAGIPHALGADMYAHPEKYVHEWCEFTFMEQLDTGGYRHPFFNRMRDSKD